MSGWTTAIRYKTGLHEIRRHFGYNLPWPVNQYNNWGRYHSAMWTRLPALYNMTLKPVNGPYSGASWSSERWGRLGSSLAFLMVGCCWIHCGARRRKTPPGTVDIKLNQAFPILNILVPQVGHTPFVAGLPFFMVIPFGSFISLLARHFTQYACIFCLLSLFDCESIHAICLPHGWKYYDRKI